MKRDCFGVVCAALFFAAAFCSSLSAENLNFDFGLSLFGLEEIHFENTKTPDFNLRLMKKYISEHENSEIQQLHCIVRWFNLLKLSDTPKRKALYELSNEYFLSADVNKSSINALINRVFYEGLALSLTGGANGAGIAAGADGVSANGAGIAAGAAGAAGADGAGSNGAGAAGADGASADGAGANGVGVCCADETASADCEQNNAYDACEAYEDLLFDLEEPLAENCFYWLAKGIVFYHLKHAQIDYFMPMKPDEDLKRAVALVPKEPIYYYALGQAFRLLNSTDVPMFLAIACYEKASALAPRNTRLQNALLGIYLGLHEEYQEKGKPEPFWFEEAVYKKILSVSPNNPHALNNLGYLYAEYGVNLKTALELCQKAVDISPENPLFKDSLGWAAFKNREFKKAEDELIKSLQLRPNVYEPHYHLATLYYSEQKYKEAALHYENAINLRPDSAETLNNLAYLYAEQNIKLDEALAYAKKATELDQGNGSYLDTLGWVYFRLNKLTEAMNCLKKANEASPGQSEILMHIGCVYLEQSNFDSAINYLKEAYKLNGALKNADEALYSAVCLKAYRGALADYHSMLGKNAEPNKIISMLLSLARFYQENSAYNKAIEINKLCADIKNGKITLDKPIFDDYEIKSPKLKDTPKVTLSSVSATEQSGLNNNPSAVDAQNSESKTNLNNSLNGGNKPQTGTESADNQTNSGVVVKKQQTNDEKPTTIINYKSSIKMSPADKGPTEDASVISFVRPANELGFQFIFSFGPRFFDFAKDYIYVANAFKDKSVSFFINDLFYPAGNTIIKLSDASVKGDVILKLLKDYIANFMPTSAITSENSAAYKFRGGSELYFVSKDNSVFISEKPLNTALVNALKDVCPFSKTAFIETIFDWNILSQNLPGLLKYVLVNPFEPFELIHNKYTLENDCFDKTTLYSTGKAENDEFIKKLSRRLFVHKALLSQKGIDASVKIKTDCENIYVAVRYGSLTQLIQKQTKAYASAMPVLRLVAKALFGKELCFLNRVFFTAEKPNCCPLGGTIEYSPYGDAINCTYHKYLPSSPMLLSPQNACLFNRKRLELFIKKHPDKMPIDQNELAELAKELNIGLCPLNGTWSLKDGKIECSCH